MLTEPQQLKMPPLKELRTLRRAGLTGAAAARLPGLLAELHDTLDLEAAGTLLSGESERTALLQAGYREQRIALLGSSSLLSLSALLTASHARQEIACAVREGEFNQWRLEVASGAPSFVDFAPRVVCCLLDDAVLFEGLVSTDLPAIERAAQALPDELARWVDRCQESLPGLVVLNTIALRPLRVDALIDYRSKARLAASFARMNAAILALGESKRRTVVVDTALLSERVGTTFCDARLRHTASQVYATNFLRAYADELARISRAELGLAKKVLALDLDNTLWGGVIGDDGVGGIKLGGGYPGNAHLELQQLARDLSSQGVLLTVCSKNDDAIAREAITTHPEMALRGEVFSAFTANWEPKPGNLLAQAERLNLGVDAFVFLDDNPVERGLMREQAPRVTTLEVPRDPSGYASQLAAAGHFNQLELTDEDRARTEQYRAQVQREQLSSHAGSLEDYLHGLDQQLRLEPLDGFNAGRVVQLFGKTNQFNLTGRRYGEGELDARVADKTGWVIAARLSDRFGDNGLIGALSLLREGDGWAIENFVLSCRVFSRQVEQTIVGLVLQAARARGRQFVSGHFVESAKNKKFARFFAEQGFVETSAGEFTHALADAPVLPACVKVISGMEAFHGF